MRSAGRSAFTSGIVVLLLVLAVVLGYATDLLWIRWEQYRYPMRYVEDVGACAEQYELDEAIIYAMIKELSNFASNRVSDDGRIGLMQLSEETFRQLTDEHLHENLDSGLLYEPSTNIRYGCYYLLYLTGRYDTWEAIYAAYLCGENVVDGWYESWQVDPDAAASNFDIPDAEIRKKVERIQHTVDKYKELYKQKGEDNHESDESR